MTATYRIEKVKAMTTIPERLIDARAGDTILYYEADVPIYNENKKYIGRGAWSFGEITEISRHTIVCRDKKFYRSNGRVKPGHGYPPDDFIAGQQECRDFAIRQRAQEISGRVLGATADQLRRIVAILDEKP